MNIVGVLNIFSVLVTGANRGFGLQYVKQLSQLENAPEFIFASYRNEKTLQDLQDVQASSLKSQIILIKMDVTFSEDIKGAKKIIEEKVGDRGLTLLINNAGVQKVQQFPNLDQETMEFHYRTNTIAPIRLFQILLPLLEKASKFSNSSKLSISNAAVLSMESQTASITKTGVVFTVDLVTIAYKMSKAALNMGMRAIAATTKDQGILVVNICPGFAKTDMGGPDAPLKPEESIGQIIETLPKLNEIHNGAYIDRFANFYPF